MSQSHACCRRLASLGLASIAWTASCPSSAASGAFVTDEASLVAYHAWQVESWFRQAPGGLEYWVLPAAQPVRNFELTIGAVRGEPSLYTGSPGLLFQGKALFKPLEPGTYGVGVVLGGVAHPGASARQDTIYAYVPVSVSLLGDRLLLHANLGWLHDAGVPPGEALTWAGAALVKLGSGFETELEAYGDTRSQASLQAGLRWWLVPDRLQLDGIVGGPNARPGWVSVGLNFYPRAWSQGP